MKKIIITILVLFLIGLSFADAQKKYTIKLKTEKKQCNLKATSKTNFRVDLSFAQIELTSKTVKEGSFVNFFSENLTKIYKKAYPNVPVYSKLIEVPFGAEIEHKIISYSEEIIKLSDYGIREKIMPAQRSISKNEDPEDVPFEYNKKVYKKNKFLYTNVVEYVNVGVFRDKRLARLIVRPVQYNPAKNIVKVLNNLKIEISFIKSDFDRTNRIKKKYYSPFFTNVFANKFIDANKNAEKEFITSSPVTYVIVSDRMFETQLQDFINWKKLKGFHVIAAYTDDIGNTNSEIKTYLQNLYENPETDVNPPSFVLFVGDVEQIPAWNTGDHVTDLRYCEYTGDNIPEVYYGRFSAQNTSQLQPQIDKTLLYEKYLMSDPSYLQDQVLVAGEDSEYAPTYGNGAINYAVEYYTNDSHNINPLTYLYKDAANSTVMESDNASASSSIINKISQGVGFANYTAHCGPSGWSDPSFKVSDVSGLSNAGKYGLLIGNCCQSVTFNNSECFGEAILRAENKGAIGYIGGSNNTYWDEDYWWGIGLTSNISANPTYENSESGVYDGVFHDKNNETDNQESWYITQGQIQVCGNLAVEESASSRKQYYWEIYHLMGDPSVVPYMGVPTDLSVSINPSAIIIGMNSIDVTTEPNAYIALSQNGDLLSTAYANSTSGLATLNFQAGVLSSGEADIVITAQNKKPYIEKISVNPADEPYVSLCEFSTDISPDYGKNIKLNIEVSNIAEEGSGYDANNVIANLLTDDADVTIIEGVHDYGTIVAGDTITLNNVFEIKLSDTIEDQKLIRLNLKITGSDASDDYTWNSTINIVANAPEFEIDSVLISNDTDGNGRLDHGESADLNVKVKNTGHADAGNVKTVLSIPSTDISIDDNSIMSVLNAGSSEILTFRVSASNDIDNGTQVFVNSLLSQGEYTTESTDSFIVGQPNDIIVGNGNLSPDEYYAFDNYFMANKTQILYKGAEIGIGALVIQKVAFDFSEIGSIKEYLNLKICIKQTTLTELSASYADMSDAVTVLNKTEYIMPDNIGWHEFDIDNYTFDSNSNLLIEISWGLNADWSNERYIMNCTNYENNYVTYGFSDDVPDPAPAGYSTLRPNAKFIFNDIFTCSFVVQNSDFEPIPNAVITIGEQNKNVDQSGNASFTLVKGEYAYNVAAENYYETESNFTLNKNENILVEMTEIPIYNANFSVKNQNSVTISGTNITIGAISIVTDNFGVAEIDLFEGDYTYSVVADNYYGVTGNFTLNSNNNILVEMKKLPEEIKILSNPVKDKVLRVEMIAFFDTYKIEVYNMQGQIIYNNIKSGNILEVNLSNNASGIYLLKIITDTRTFTEKIMLR